MAANPKVEYARQLDLVLDAIARAEREGRFGALGSLQLAKSVLESLIGEVPAYPAEVPAQEQVPHV